MNVCFVMAELLMAGKLTKAGDVYAFGVLLWGLCMGKLPWAGLRPVQIIMQVPLPSDHCVPLLSDHVY